MYTYVHTGRVVIMKAGLYLTRAARHRGARERLVLRVTSRSLPFRIESQDLRDLASVKLGKSGTRNPARIWGANQPVKVKSRSGSEEIEIY